MHDKIGFDDVDLNLKHSTGVGTGYSWMDDYD